MATQYQVDMGRRAKTAIKRLQSSVGTDNDGYWGESSQKALIKSGYVLSFDWVKLREHFGRFDQSQVDGFNATLNALNTHKENAINPAYAAYILSTKWHETAHTMRPIAEIGKGGSRKYGKWYKNSKGVVYAYANSSGKTYLQSEYPYLYFGRGDTQLTWLDNYLKMGRILGVDLANNPDLAMNPDISSKIIIEGMLRGSFTGLSLKRCINYGLYFEFIKARRIINGVDRDDLLADYAVQFLECLKLVKGTGNLTAPGDK